MRLNIYSHVYSTPLRHSRAGGNPFCSLTMKQPCVYILANKARGTLYIGVTSDLIARIWQHKNEVVQGFSQKYALHYLVYYEMHGIMLEAIAREKQLKKWNRDWKIKLIEGFNENWTDLYSQIV